MRKHCVCVCVVLKGEEMLTVYAHGNRRATLTEIESSEANIAGKEERRKEQG